MTQLQSWLFVLLEGHREWTEKTRAVLLAHGLPAAELEETLRQIVALQREIAGSDD